MALTTTRIALTTFRIALNALCSPERFAPIGKPVRRLARTLAHGWVLVLFGFWLSAAPAGAVEPIRIGITPVILDDHTSFLRSWQEYLEERLGRPVSFVQRASYRGIVELTLDGQVDFAWLCGYPYAAAKDRLQLVAVPTYRQQPLYQSYLIVPAEDGATRELAELEGKVFAFSDPDSNSGFLVPVHQLARMGRQADSFFKKAFFTGAHRKVVEAVALGLAQGGAVDGYVWDTLDLLHPEITRETRIVARSDEYGFPPIVAGMDVPPETLSAMRAVLLDMAAQPAGARLLRQLNLDGFVVGDESLYDGIVAMLRVSEQHHRAAQP
jgi:phosphonate transport system substrate-binding protein